MAEIVLGIGCAHTPQLHTAAESWKIRANRDRTNGIELWWKGEKWLWDDLLKARQADGLDLKQSELDAQAQSRLDASFKAIDKLVEKYEEVKPDIAIICGNDQHELFINQIQPTFTVIAAEEIENMPRTGDQQSRLPPGIALSDHGHLPPEHMRFRGQPELGTHITERLSANDFDVAYSKIVPKPEQDKATLSGMPHAFGFIYRNLMQDNPIPHVPIVLNSFFGPNRPSARRCYDFGRCVGQAVQAWDSDARIVVIASGGLSHFVIDEEFDRELLQAFQDKNLSKFFDLPDTWYRAGSSECKNWIMAAGILSVTEMNMSVVDYQTLPRTEAGTGSTCAFTIWE